MFKFNTFINTNFGQFGYYYWKLNRSDENTSTSYILTAKVVRLSSFIDELFLRIILIPHSVYFFSSDNNRTIKNKWSKKLIKPRRWIVIVNHQIWLTINLLILCEYSSWIEYNIAKKKIIIRKRIIKYVWTYKKKGVYNKCKNLLTSYAQKRVWVYILIHNLFS